MSDDFTIDELREVVRAARVYSPGFSEEQVQSLVVLGKRLTDSGYLEAVRGLARLECQGVSCVKALDEFEALKQRGSELEQRVNNIQAKLECLEGKAREAEKEYQQIKAATEQVKAEREKAAKALAAFRAEADKTRRDIDEEVTECRKKANVTEQEVAAAGQLREEIENHGFSLELMLGLSAEFAGHENARSELAGALEKHSAFSRYLAAINKEGEARKKTLTSETSQLQADRDKRQVEIKGLEAARHNLEDTISRLQYDLADEEAVRRFYRRYWSVTGLMEYLATWDQVIFLRCNNPLSAMAGFFNPPSGTARFLTDKPAIRCPHCGQNQILFDKKAYAALNWPVGAPGRLSLGE